MAGRTTLERRVLKVIAHRTVALTGREADEPLRPGQERIDAGGGRSACSATATSSADASTRTAGGSWIRSSPPWLREEP